MADKELQARGNLARRLSSFREMLPGSFVERRRKCGKLNCRCAKKQDEFHLQFQLSVLWKGKPYTFHIPAEMAEEVRNKVEMRKQFQDLVAKIFEINLRRFLRRKEGEGKENP